MFTNDKAAVEWFEYWHSPDAETACIRCESPNCYRVKTGKPMLYRCRECKKSSGPVEVDELGVHDKLDSHEVVNHA